MTWETLADTARAVGAAQLESAGVPPLDEPADARLVAAAAGRDELWYAGRGHAAGILRAVDEPPLPPGTDHDLASAVSTLSLPTELLLLLGGDDRMLPSAAADGANGYGMPVYDVDPVLRLSSCTATPPDAVTLAAAGAWRREALAAVQRADGIPIEQLRRPVVQRLLEVLRLPRRWGDRVVLSPSGTDIETLVTAIVLGSRPRPVLNVLVGAREAGSGTRLAASGRWFRDRAPFGPVSLGAPVDGFDIERLDVLDVDVRDRAGRPRRAFDIEAELDAHIREALGDDRDVLVHLMAGSKTELRQPTLGWLRELRAAYPTRVRAVVDAAQGRLPAAELRHCLDAGASVFLTGSKAISGPPFCAALVMDSSLLGDARRLDGLPLGLAASVAQADLPPFLAPHARAWEPVNLPLLGRWSAALDEWERLVALPGPARLLTTEALIGALRRELTAMAAVELLPDACPDPTILSFLVRDDAGWAGAETMRAVYAALLRSGAHIGQPVEIVRDGPTALRVAVGAATLSRLLASDVAVMPAVRALGAHLREHLTGAVAAGLGAQRPSSS